VNDVLEKVSVATVTEPAVCIINLPGGVPPSIRAVTVLAIVVRTAVGCVTANALLSAGQFGSRL
jgi:hypothetical protein